MKGLRGRELILRDGACGSGDLSHQQFIVGGDERARVGRQGFGYKNLRVALGFVGHNTVLLLELLPADPTGELVERVGVVFLHVPVQGGFLSAGEAAELTL